MADSLKNDSIFVSGTKNKMGYDYGECFACYCLGWGDTTQTTELNVCFTCLELCCPRKEGSEARGRVWSETVKETELRSEICNLCKLDRTFVLCGIPMCHIHSNDCD